MANKLINLFNLIIFISIHTTFINTAHAKKSETTINEVVAAERYLNEQARVKNEMRGAVTALSEDIGLACNWNSLPRQTVPKSEPVETSAGRVYSAIESEIIRTKLATLKISDDSTATQAKYSVDLRQALSDRNQTRLKSPRETKSMELQRTMEEYNGRAIGLQKAADIFEQEVSSPPPGAQDETLLKCATAFRDRADEYLSIARNITGAVTLAKQGYYDNVSTVEDILAQNNWLIIEATLSPPSATPAGAAESDSMIDGNPKTDPAAGDTDETATGSAGNQAR